MQYFKNTQLAKLYPVSEKAVRNWIQSARSGKLDIELHETSKRSYIANTPQNLVRIEQLVRDRKKYSNKLTHKVISPTEQFYKIYSESQIFDIINSLEVYSEFPLKYSYFDKGAEIWDGYTRRQIKENFPSAPLATMQLLDLNRQYIDYLIKPYRRINIVCVGGENFASLRKFLQYLLDKGVIGRVILVASSRSMLEVAQRHVGRWFQGRIELEIIERDMQFERLNDLLARETLRKDAGQSLNLYLMMGSIIYNFQSPIETLKMIHRSLGSRDILIHDAGLDTEERRGFNLSFGLAESLSPRLKLFMDMLGLDEFMYEIERFYDTQRKQRIIRLRLKISITMKFKFSDGERAVNFNKDDYILIFRFWHYSSEDIMHILKDSGFNLLHASHTKGKAHLLTVSSVSKQRGV